MGYYETEGYLGEEGEAPWPCEYCGKPAKWSTAHSGVFLCGKESCLKKYRNKCMDKIKYVRTKVDRWENSWEKCWAYDKNDKDCECVQCRLDGDPEDMEGICYVDPKEEEA